MPSELLPDFSGMPELPAAIKRLSNREADRLLVQAEADRRAEIDAYWAVCLADPVQAARVADKAPPLVRDLCLLAGQRDTAVPRPSGIGSLFVSTARLLAVEAVRNSLLGDYTLPTNAEQVDRLWEDGQVVALKVVGDQPVLVMRYGPLMFNPGTVPEAALLHAEDCFIELQREGDGNGGEIEFVTAYVISTMCDNGQWGKAKLDLRSRSCMMRDLKAMETLVGGGGISNAYFDATPLPAFPTHADSFIGQLHAHQAALRAAGAMPLDWQAALDARTAPLHARITQLRRRMERMEEEQYRVRCRIKEVEACTLEEETGLTRGARVRHTFTGYEGVLEIVNFDFKAQFRLSGTTTYVTEDIRRGEWQRVKLPVGEP